MRRKIVILGRLFAESSYERSYMAFRLDSRRDALVAGALRLGSGYPHMDASG